MIVKRKNKAGKNRYGVKVDRPGRSQEWVGTFDTLAEARQAESRARSSRPVKQMTCDRYVTHWLKGYRERVKPSSYDAAVSALKGFSQDFRGIPMGRVDSLQAEEWARENRWRVPAVITVWNAAVKADLCAKNPFAGQSPKSEGRKRLTPLTAEQVEAMAQAAPTESTAALIRFLAYSGLRVGEAFALEWSDVDFQAMRIQVHRRLYRGQLDLPKNNRVRLAMLTPQARDALLPLDRSTDTIFVGKQGGRLSQSLLTWYWATIGTAVPRKTTPHELRHFAAHYLYVQMGLHERIVAAQLGHTDGGKLIRELYGHGDVGALEELDRAFANVIPIEKARSA